MDGDFTFIRHTDDVPALMEACGIVVSASVEPEAFGRIAAEGGRAGIPVGMCGEAASDPRLAPLFLAFGITELSMAPAQVLRMKEAITRLDLGKAEECIKRVLSAATAAEVLKIMEECW